MIFRKKLISYIGDKHVEIWRKKSDEKQLVWTVKDGVKKRDGRIERNVESRPRDKKGKFLKNNNLFGVDNIKTSKNKLKSQK